jgi:Mg2+ and Co2+ transporter CorA
VCVLLAQRPSTPRAAAVAASPALPFGGSASTHAAHAAAAHGYRTPGAFVAQMVEFLIDDAAQVVAQLQDDLDEFEEGGASSSASASASSAHASGNGASASGGAASAHAAPSLAHAAYGDDAAIAALSEHRRLAVKLRRWVGPQREALKDLVLKGSLWLYADDDAARHKLREAMDATAHLAESLDAIREHALVLKDELSALQQSRANHALYVLSMVSALFLPFSFVTGLLSMSVGGIPGQRDERAFYVVSFGCVALLLLGCVLFRRLRWL